ncbi:MAG: pyruvate flavodoxin/ferredoxin oxidoreductase [Deltaproteobacteria bacterium]|nr:pyruvate flavodoxin/ferredoxin oxidoreductase [Deltaproteobacteria bacterium]
MREFVTGAELIVRAALDAGCNFFAGYPITPASGILGGMMRQLPPRGGIAIQGEDEIASIGMCLGAAAAGRKAMTATSGPGLSLYSENIGFAQMAELPLVIVAVQRMGPGTGGATTNAEGDVEFVRWAAPGGYPMVVLAPSMPMDAYTLTIEAFNRAEQLRAPVFLLTCRDLVMNGETVAWDGTPQPALVERTLAKELSEFQPYRIDQSADVPPFAPIGGDLLTRINTSVHDARGLLVKRAAACAANLQHLADKVSARAGSWERVAVDLDANAATVIVAYGAAARSARAAVRLARACGEKLSLVVVHSLWPVPEVALRNAVGSHQRIVVPEHNLGQYVQEIERLFADRSIRSVTRIDGRALTPEQLLAEVV